MAMFRVAREIDGGSKFLVETYGSTTEWNEEPSVVLSQEVSAEHEIPESEFIPVFRGDVALRRYLAEYAEKTRGSIYRVVDEGGAGILADVANTMLVRDKGPVVKTPIERPEWYMFDRKLLDGLSVSLAKRVLQRGQTSEMVANTVVFAAAVTVLISSFMAYVSATGPLVLLMCLSAFVWAALDRTLQILGDNFHVVVSANSESDRLLAAKLASVSFLVVAPVSGACLAVLILATEKHFTFLDKALVEFLRRNYVLAMSWNLVVYCLLGVSPWPCLFGLFFLWISKLMS